MMFGYASDETEEYMPYPAAMAHKLARRLTEVRKNGTLPYLRPDGKTQVTVEYDENGVPKRLDAVVLSTQHDPEVTQERIHEDIKKYVFDEVIPANMTDDETKFFINPTGRFVIGGPHGDSGLTGRKIKVLTDDLHKLCIRNLPCAERIYGYRRRLRYADGIRKLDLASSRKTCRNNIFRRITRRICRGTIHFCTIFSRESSAAVTRHSSVSINNDFTSGGNY